MKKTICMLLSVLMLLAALPMAGHAAEIIAGGTCGEVDEEKGLDGSLVTWTLDSDGTLIVNGQGAIADYDTFRSPWYNNNAINTVVFQNGITKIGANAFQSCKKLKAMIIPNSVTEIGFCAFSYCSLLAEVTIPSGVTKIGDAAFESCKGLTAVTISESVKEIGSRAFSGCGMLEEMTIPNSVMDIGAYAFWGCKKLRTMTIPDGVKIIKYGTFRNCAGLTDVTIPDSVTCIEEYAFEGCDGLTAVTIPASVTDIKSCAFFGCTALTEITVDTENPIYYSKENCIIHKESKTLVIGCKNSIIPIDGSVTDIGTNAFGGCTGLTTVTIPDCVTRIGECAFDSCTGLTEIYIPESISTIETYAFYRCTGLTKVTLPNSLMNIEAGTFYDCSGLTQVIIPDHVTTIDGDAFAGCSGLTQVTIPDSVTNIGEYAFYGCVSLTNIILPQNVTEIGSEAIPAHTLIHGYVGSYTQQWAEENNRAFMAIGEAAITLTVSEIVSEPSVIAYGFVTPGAEVVCSVNGIDTVTVQAAASGRWRAEIPLTGAKDGDSFTIKAAVTLDDKTAEQTAIVIYQPDAIVFRQFTLNHRFYSVNITAENRGFSVPNFTFVPGNPLSFKIKVTNNERIDKLYVVSTKEGASKKIELTYNRAAGLWFTEGGFDEEDKDYIPGVFTITGVDKDGKEFEAGVTIKINFLIDPSGYAYEAVRANKLEGVTAAVYYMDAKGHELLWNAETADQLNPVATLADGAFAWVVPEGKWQVRLTKDGYEEARSEWMDVPPEHTNVYIAMVSQNAPEAAYCNVYADRAEITFSQYMSIDSVNADNVKFDGYTGKITPLDKTEAAAGSGVFYAKAFAFTPDKAFAGEISVAISGVKNYADRELASPYTATFTVAAEPKNLTATREVSVAYGKTAKIEVSAENAAGKTVSVSCDSAGVTLSDKTLTLDEAGKAKLSVTGEMPGAANLTFALDGTALTASVKVAVEVPGIPAEPDQPAEPEIPEYTPGDVDGDGEVTSGDARLALRASVQLEKYEPGTAAFLAADADGNGEIESADARTILRVSVKLESF